MQILTEKIFAWSLDMGFLKATFATFVLLSPIATCFFFLSPTATKYNAYVFPLILHMHAAIAGELQRKAIYGKYQWGQLFISLYVYIYMIYIFISSSWLTKYYTSVFSIFYTLTLNISSSQPLILYNCQVVHAFVRRFLLGFLTICYRRE